MKLALASLLATLMIVSSRPVVKTFVEGETLDYSVSWMKITGGTARMTIAAGPDDTYRITSIAKSSGGLGRMFKVRDQIETTVSRSDFSTLRMLKHLDERGDQKKDVTVIEDGVATRTRQKVRKVSVPRPVMDPISVIYYFRTLDLTPGKSYELTLYSDLKVYTVHAHIVRREVVDTPAGRFTAIRVEPEMITTTGKPREERLTIWYSDDDRRLPVRIRTEVNFGSVTASLMNVSSGVTSIDPPALAR